MAVLVVKIGRSGGVGRLGGEGVFAAGSPAVMLLEKTHLFFAGLLLRLVLIF
jgi:hypothetical protein